MLYAYREHIGINKTTEWKICSESEWFWAAGRLNFEVNQFKIFPTKSVIYFTGFCKIIINFKTLDN